MTNIPYKISQTKLTKELKAAIYNGFHEHAIASVESDGNMEDLTLVAEDHHKFLGAVHAKTFWGALHIKYLFVNPESRSQGIGKALINQVLKDGKTLGCRFAFVETMNFQALNFYKMVGFKEEFSRNGFDKGTSFHYLKLDFEKK